MWICLPIVRVDAVNIASAEKKNNDRSEAMDVGRLAGWCDWVSKQPVR